MSVLSPTRDIYALGAIMDKNSKSMLNYSPAHSYFTASKYEKSSYYDTSKQFFSAKKSPLLTNSKKNFLSEALVRKTIEDLDTQVSTKVQSLRKSQYNQLSQVMRQPYEEKSQGIKPLSQQKRGKSAASSKRSRLTVNYTDSLQEMTKSLVIYDQLLEVKRQEKQDLINHIKQLKLDIKHTKDNHKRARAQESDLFRENKKIKRVTKRKNEDCFFFEKEIIEIKQQIPELAQSIKEYRAMNQELGIRIEQEIQTYEEEKEIIPKLLSAISEVQLQKDKLSTEIVKQQKLKERLNEDVVKIVCESNFLYKRTENNVMYQPKEFVK
eukprot:403343049